MEQSNTHPHPYLKLIAVIISLLIAAVIGYLVVYWWVFGNFDQIINVSVLRNQIIATQKAGSVKAQLQELGYQVEEDDFFQLNSPSTVNYHADVLGGYEPVRTDEMPEDSYYFYDENGTAIYFRVDEDGQVDPEDFIILNRE